MTQHTCDYCGDTYPSIIAAALCCDPAAYGDELDDDPAVILGID